MKSILNRFLPVSVKVLKDVYKRQSQEELAKKCGVSRQTVNAIENDKYDPTLALAFHLARELDTTVDTLFTPD